MDSLEEEINLRWIHQVINCSFTWSDDYRLLVKRIWCCDEWDSGQLSAGATASISIMLQTWQPRRPLLRSLHGRRGYQHGVAVNFCGGMFVKQWKLYANKPTKYNFQCTSYKHNNSRNRDPPLLHQAYWLADSELILPNKGTSDNSTRSEDYGQGRYKETKHEEEEGSSGGQGRRCRHCLSQRTPQWRAGPEGPKTLCNACGVRYKSGRLLPEYRPAKSPSFVSYKHSNSHKKVLEMRMCS
ncbi:unnamed protein product [Lactuca saligna]|uniref:GATA-type domain-containing protein n=1 Tax=Lactuca saligna TaxID=75948 RepID=A0AA35VRT6_LACSI|nr:unnamed protein product [Lactuca saligna]